MTKRPIKNALMRKISLKRSVISIKLQRYSNVKCFVEFLLNNSRFPQIIVKSKVDELEDYVGK